MTYNTIKLINEYLMQGGYSPGIDSEALESEASLIAAAPDLLAALENLMVEMPFFPAGSDGRAAFIQARDAVAKAKGQ